MEISMIDHSSYWINGMGLHSSQLKELETIILNQNIKTIVEFGSGQSSRFLNDLKTLHNLDYSVTSFDHNDVYAFESSIIRDLVSCSDDTFDSIFDNGINDKRPRKRNKDAGDIFQPVPPRGQACPFHEQSQMVKRHQYDQDQEQRGDCGQKARTFPTAENQSGRCQTGHDRNQINKSNP